MLKRALIATILVTAVLASNGSSRTSASVVDPQDRPIPSQPAADTSAIPVESGEELREEFHQTYPLSATGRVSLENINGGVQIKVWDRAAVQVDAVKRAWRKERLAEAQIEVNSTEENIRIKTEYPDQDQNFRNDDRRYENPAIVEYVVTVPRKASLDSVELVNGSLDIDSVEGSVKASSINGRVNARSLKGETKLSTINGPLNAVFPQLDESKSISLGSVNGSVTLVIPSNANATIRAGTVHGGISNDFGLNVKHGDWVGHNLEGQLGTGATRIKLGNVNGGIRITHAQDGLAMSPVSSVAADSGNVERVDVSGTDITTAVVDATKVATEATKDIRIRTREIQQEAQREVDRAMRDAQREMERAQREAQRELEKEKVKLKHKDSGSGMGSGEGQGSSGSGKVMAQDAKSFTVNGLPRVNVSTFDGSVTVHGWDKSEVMYKAITRAANDEDLKQISIEGEQQGAAISIIAKSDNQQSGSVQIEVWVPRQATLHVSSDDGHLKLDGVTGELTLRSGDGAIEVMDSSGTLSVNTGDGRIHVIRFEGQVDARTGDGSISLDGNFNGLVARTGDGPISLTVPSGSNFTVETNADDDVSNEGLSVTEDITPTRRVRRWKVGNGGRVFTLKTGDGKILLRSR